MVIKMNVPKLRFKKFTMEWEYKIFDDLITNKSNIYNIQKDSNNYKCIELENIKPNLGMLNGYFNSVDQKSSKNYFFKNEILFGKLRPYLKKYWFAKFDGVCSTEFWVLKSKDTQKITNKFLYYIIQSNYFLQLCNLSTGSKMPRADWSYIKEQSIAIPILSEQEKIANTLELLDKKIELQLKKIEALKLYKLCILKYIFSSATIKTKLKSISNIKKGEQINSEELSKSGSYYMLNGGTEPSGYLEKYNTLENTITISEGGNSCGYVKYNKCKFWCGGHCYSIENKMIDNHYLYQSLKFNENKIMRLRIGSGLPNIQKKDLENFELSIHEKNDQHKIAKLLIKCDTKIELEQDLLNLLLNLKKGLMQNMFV